MEMNMEVCDPTKADENIEMVNKRKKLLYMRNKNYQNMKQSFLILRD